MKKITKLTPEQEAKMSEYVTKWTAIGLSTEPTNKERAAKNVIDYYKVAGLTPPENIVFAASPRAAMVMANILASKEYHVCKDKSKFDWKAAEKRESKNYNSNYAGGNLWAGWQAFYEFFKDEVGVPGLEIIQPTLELSKDCGWIFPYNDFCVLSEKPQVLKIRNNRLHNETGPALSYSDGFKIYALNGVIMPEWVINQPKENLKAKDILDIKNAEQRMQAMKHKGMGHFFDALEFKVLDKKNGYELLLVDHQGEMCEYLKMVNPSTGEIHLEGINPGLDTVDKALAWRNGLEYWINPQELT